MTTLATELPRQQARCREILINTLQLGRPGAFLAAMLRQSLDRAEQASAAGDVFAMIQAHEDLKSYSE